jgi:hypothetical protein
MDSSVALVFKQALLPMVAILCGVGMPTLIVYLVARYKLQRHRQLLDTVCQLADKNLPVPRELLDPPRRAGSESSPLFRAFTLIGAGVGLALMFWQMELPMMMGVGALALCVGVAQLLALGIERRAAGAGPDTPPRAEAPGL